MTLHYYIAKINILFHTLNAGEHPYRFDVQNLIMALLSEVLTSKEAASLNLGETDCMLTRSDNLMDYIEIAQCKDQISTNVEKFPERAPTLNLKIVEKFADNLGLTFLHRKEPQGNVCFANNDEMRAEFKITFTPIDILDFIFAILHSIKSSKADTKFLQVDVPTVYYPTDCAIFWKLVKLGGQLRQMHLLEIESEENHLAQFLVNGDTIVRKPKFVIFEATSSILEEKTLKTTIINLSQEMVLGKVFINETQYFEKVPKTVWNLSVGTHQPAQKWLEDRKDQKLTLVEILHYQKILFALFKIDKIIKEINEIAI